MAEPTHYDVLDLPRALLDDAKADQVPILIKQAYHRALLRHHPDKAPQPQHLKSNNNPSGSGSGSGSSSSSTSALRNQPTNYTIDQITTAHATLSSPLLRAQYDADLRTTASRLASSAGAADASFQTGVETVDLDDLACDSGGSDDDAVWFRPCRCGNERGFAFGEDDLEEAGDLGELLVGCADCSLWLRVCFAVVEDDDDDEEDRGGMGEEGREKRV